MLFCVVQLVVQLAVQLLVTGEGKKSVSPLAQPHDAMCDEGKSGAPARPTWGLALGVAAMATGYYMHASYEHGRGDECAQAVDPLAW